MTPPKMTSPVIIEDYDPLRLDQFEKLRAKIAVPDDLAVTIEHVGSTAVAGLAALKKKLAAQHQSDHEAYNQAKAGFVQNILRRAGYVSAL